MLLLVASAGAQQFKFANVLVPGAAYTTVYAVNNSDVAVGTYQADLTAPFSGFMAVGKTVTTINNPECVDTILFGINEANQIVGQCLDSSGVFHGFLYQAGSFTELLPPGATETFWASGINNTGEIVGAYLDAEANEHAFLFDGSSYQTIDEPGAVVTAGWGINDAGEITLQWDTEAGGGTSIYNGTTYTTLSVSGAAYTYAYGLNNLGTVAITWTDFLGNENCDLALANGKYISANDPAANKGTYCYDVNDHSEFVGSVGLSGHTIGFAGVVSSATTEPAVSH